MEETRFWHKEDGKKVLQEHYDRLADLFNAGSYGAIAGLYHEASTIVALKSGQVYAGTAGAVKFWTDLGTQKKVTKVSFKIKDVKLISSQHFVPRSILTPDPGQIFYQATLQKIGYVGDITYTKNPTSVEAFSGGGFHRDDCSFGFPDDEGFNF